MRGEVILVIVLVAGSAMSGAAQWPQWRGPSRDGAVAAADVPETWPARPSVKWTQKVGEGYSTPVAASGRVFLHGRQDPEEVVTALDLSSGRRLWSVKYRSAFNKNKYAKDMSKGPFSTPLLADGVLYTLGTTAVLSAFDEKTGALKWRKDWSEEIDTSRLFTGTAMSPVLDSGLLIVHVGDDDGGRFVAMDPATGTEKWRLEGHGPGYASPIVAALGGARQLITMTDRAVIGVAVADGRQLWAIPFPDEWNENIVTPVVAGDILVVSGTRKGTFGYRFENRDGPVVPAQVWHNTDVPMYMSSPVFDGDHVYGFSSKRKGQLFCLDARSGTVKWTTEGRAGANASLQLAGPNLVVLTTEGELIVVRRNSQKYEELNRYRVAESQTWAQPVVMKDGILIRDADSVSFWSF